MKTKSTNTVSKLVAKIDNELKNLLAEDLKAFRTRSLMNAINQKLTADRLTAA